MPEHTDDSIVRRLRFDTRGDLYEESTFLTERELAGIWEKQGRLPLDVPPAEQPVETAGPLLSHHKEADTT